MLPVQPVQPLVQPVQLAVQPDVQPLLQLVQSVQLVQLVQLVQEQALFCTQSVHPVQFHANSPVRPDAAWSSVTAALLSRPPTTAWAAPAPNKDTAVIAPHTTIGRVSRRGAVTPAGGAAAAGPRSDA